MARDRLSLRSRVTTTLLVLGLLSVVVLSSVNYVAVRSLLDRSVEGQITTLRDEQADTVRRGFEIVEARVAAIARDPAVVAAFVELSDGYDAIDVELTDDQVADLENYYESTVLAPYEAAGVEHPDAASLVPASAAGRYAQWRFVGGTGIDSATPIDDPSVSAYDRAHASNDAYLRAVVSTGATEDLLLISAATQEVVYSTEARVDLGSDVVDGPFAESALGRVAQQLPAARVGEPVVSDGSFYLPADAAPTIFIAATLRTDTEVIGAVAVSVPTSVLTSLTTAEGQWDSLGLGTTGETYIVGSDGTLRSESRRFLENPDDYLDVAVAAGLTERRAGLIDFTGSTVLLQTVDNALVTEALGGDAAVGNTRNYLGDATVAAVAPVDVAGLQWAIVAEQSQSETSDSLARFRRTTLLLLAIELPIIVLIGMLFAHRVVRPIRPLVSYASNLSNGDLDSDTVDLGHDELGDVARQLGEVSRELRAQEAALAAEEQRIADMLSAVLPQRLVERVRRGDIAISDIADTATVVSVSIVDLPDLASVDQEEAIEVTSRVTAHLSALADEHGVERLHLSPDHQIFVSGLGSPDPDVERAIGFILAVPDVVAAATVDTHVHVDVRVGAAAGDVATGLLGTSQPSFGVWGDPTSIAVTLTAVAEPGDVLVDRSIVDAVNPSWHVEPHGEIVVGDETVEVFSVSVLRR